MKTITRKLKLITIDGRGVWAVKWRGRWYDYNAIKPIPYDQPGPNNELAFHSILNGPNYGVSLVRLFYTPDNTGQVTLGEYTWR